MRQVATLLLSLMVLITIGCGWNRRNMIGMLPQIKKIILDSRDPNSPLSRAIRNQFRLNRIALIEKGSSRQDIPSFRILSCSLHKDTISIFQDGHTAEYQIMLSINAAILIPGKDLYPINTKVYRSFFDNPQSALAKDAEQQIIINEMYDKAAEQLIYKLSKIELVSKDTSTGHSDPLISSNTSATMGQ